MAKKDMTFEEKMKRLSEIAVEMDKGEHSLDMLLKLYEEGIQLYRACNKVLETTEAKIQMLTEGDTPNDI